MSRKFTDGSGGNSTVAAIAYLNGASVPVIYTAVKIQLGRWTSNPSDGTASYLKNPILLTDCPAAFLFPPIGTFSTAAIKPATMNFEIGIDYQGFQVVWNPGPNDLVLPATVATANVPTPPLSIVQGVLQGVFDGAYISVYKVVMPALGNPPVYDPNTYGVCLLHTGMVDAIDVTGGEITFSVGSIINQQNQQVPSQLIGPNSRFATLDPLAYAGSTQRYGSTIGAITLMAERVGTTPSVLVSQNWPSGYTLPPSGYFDGGFVVWVQGPLLAMRRGIAHSISDPNVGFQGTLTFLLSQPFPYDQNAYSAGYTVGFAFDAYSTRNPQRSDPLYNGFPFVPNPVDGI
jgi:hypothetical protein